MPVRMRTGNQRSRKVAEEGRKVVEEASLVFKRGFQDVVLLNQDGSARVFAVLVFGAEIRMPMTVASLVAMETLNVTRMAVGSEVFAAVRVIAMVSVVAIEVIVDVSPEVPVTMEPWTSTDKYAAGEPLGSIVAIGSALIRRVVEITIGTDWRRPNLDRNLCVRLLGRSRET